MRPRVHSLSMPGVPVWFHPPRREYRCTEQKYRLNHPGYVLVPNLLTRGFDVLWGLRDALAMYNLRPVVLGTQYQGGIPCLLYALWHAVPMGFVWNWQHCLCHGGRSISGSVFPKASRFFSSRCLCGAKTNPLFGWQPSPTGRIAQPEHDDVDRRSGRTKNPKREVANRGSQALT